MANTLKRVQLSELVDNDNVRTNLGDLDELAESIVNTGLLEPLVTFKHEDGYLVVAGHRRKGAIALAVANGLLPEDYPIDIIVRPAVSREEQVAMMLVENMQRVDLPVKDQVHGIFALAGEHNWPLATIAERLGQTLAMVKQRSKWGVLPDSILDRVDAGNLRTQDLDALVKLPAPVQQKLIKQGSKLSNWDIEAAAREQKNIGETRTFARNLGKLGHIAVDVGATTAKGNGMPADAAAFIENLGDDKTTTKVDVWSTSNFIGQASKIIVPALLLVVRKGHQWQVDIITSVENAGAWKPKTDRFGRNTDVRPDDELTDYEQEERRLRVARDEAIEQHALAVKAAQVSYVTDTKPAELVKALLLNLIEKQSRQGWLAKSAWFPLEALGIELGGDEKKNAQTILTFAAQNGTNLARTAAALMVVSHSGLVVPELEQLGRGPDWDEFRIDKHRFDEDGRRLSDEERDAAEAFEKEQYAKEEAINDTLANSPLDRDALIAAALLEREEEGDPTPEELAAIECEVDLYIQAEAERAE